MEVASATNLTVGIRYTVERRDFRGNEVLGFPDGSSQIIPDAQHKIFDKPTWRLALDHHFTPDVMGYVSYNRGFKSGGFNDALLPTLEFSPEVLDAYETGLNTTVLDRHLSLDVAGFYYKYKNIQAFQYFENGSAFVYNAGAAQLYGFDFDAKLKLSEKLSLTAGLEAMHTEYTSFPTAAISTPIPGGGTAYSIGSAKGNRLPLTPNLTLSITGDYVIPLAALGDLTLTSTFAYSDGFYGEADNRLRQPAYHVVNAQVSWNSSDHIYMVRLWGRNLTDAEYTSSLGSQPNGDFAVFAPPRTYGVTISRNF
jgi:iron complex outermembrane receptor protein